MAEPAFVALRRYNLTNVPEALRQMANRIEAGEITATKLVVAYSDDDGHGCYSCFGRDGDKPEDNGEYFSTLEAIGLLEIVKASMLKEIV